MFFHPHHTDRASIMKRHIFHVFLFAISCYCMIFAQGDTEDASIQENHVVISFLVRNKAHSLPYFLFYLQNLDYPKDKITLWLEADHNADNSVEIIREWLTSIESEYHQVTLNEDTSATDYPDATGQCHWSPLRMRNVITKRHKFLDDARNSKFNYLLMTDADNILYNSQTLKVLMSKNLVAVAPMLNVSASEHYSNFWCGMDDRGFYQRTEEYKPIQLGHKLGLHKVPMIHSTLLIDLSHPDSRLLGYEEPPNYSGPIDDIIIFALTAKANNVPLYVLNEDFYGFTMVPMDAHNTLQQEREQFMHLITHAIVEDVPLKKLYFNCVDDFSDKNKLIFDQIYVINLERREDRRKKMAAILDEMNIAATFVNAVDGKLLNLSYLNDIGYRQLPGYLDPHSKRDMTLGEIGCFLSHYFVWQDVLEHNYQSVLVLEDDVRFGPYFHTRLNLLMNDVKKYSVNYDLLYLGRKVLYYNKEYYVEDSKLLVWPYYTYWTVGYMLTFTGAYKLVTQNPLEKMLPVDEYLPIMFNQHPRTEWSQYFEPRNLAAVSAHPLLIEPTHYTGEPGYFTDTETSRVVDLEFFRARGDDGSLEDFEDSSTGFLYDEL